MNFSQDFSSLYMNIGILKGMVFPLSVTVYQGEQPAAADFITNFVGNYDNTSPNLLVHFDGFNLQISPQNSSLLTTTNFPTATPINSGNIGWCCIWNTAVDISTLVNVVPKTKFILATVTDYTGTGILKLKDSLLSAGTPETVLDLSILIAIPNGD